MGPVRARFFRRVYSRVMILYHRDSRNERFGSGRIEDEMRATCCSCCQFFSRWERRACDGGRDGGPRSIDDYCGLFLHRTFGLCVSGCPCAALFRTLARTSVAVPCRSSDSRSALPIGEGLGSMVSSSASIDRSFILRYAQLGHHRPDDASTPAGSPAGDPYRRPLPGSPTGGPCRGSATQTPRTRPPSYRHRLGS